jgi:hypothetical protein
MARPPTDRSSRGVAILLGLLALALVCFQFVTLKKFDTIAPGVSFLSFTRFWETVEHRIDFELVDGMLMLAILLLAGFLVLLELWAGRLTAFLDQVFASERRTLLLLASGSLVCVRFYLAPGALWTADAPQHVSYAHMTAQAMARGEIPIWTNYLGSGSPYLQFYGFLFFYLVGLIDLLCSDIFLSLKLAMAGSHVVSGMGMYLLVRRVCLSRRAGFLAGLAYVLCFWHTQQVLVMGRLPLSLFYGLLPWPFYFFERLRHRCYRAGNAGAGALALGGLALTHPGYGFWATVLLGLYAGWRLVGLYGSRSFIPILGYSLALLMGGLIFGGYLTLPLLLERGHTGLYSHIGFGGESIPGPTWRHVLVWSNFRFWLLPFSEEEFHWYGGYLGLSLIGFACVGLVGWLRRGGRQRQSIGCAVGCGLGFFSVLAFAHHVAPLVHLQIVQAMPAVRYLLFVAFCLAFAAGLGAHVLLAGRPRGSRLCAWLLIAVVMDLGGTTFQQPFVAEELSRLIPYEKFRELARPYQERGELPDYRLFWARGDIYFYLGFGQIQVEGQTPFPHGYHPGELRTVAEFTHPLERFFSTVMRQLPAGDEEMVGRLNDIFYDSMGMLNVGLFLLSHDEKTTKALNLSASSSPVLVSARVAEFPVDGAAVAARKEEADTFLDRAIPGGYDAEWRRQLALPLWLVQHSGVNLGQKRCDRIFLLDFSGERDLGTDPEVDMLVHRVWNQRVELEMRVSAACFVRLAYSYYPHLRVEVDGLEVEPLQTGGRFIALPLEEGKHRIVLEPQLSPLRRVLLCIDVLLLVGMVGMWVRERRVGAVRTSSAA